MTVIRWLFADRRTGRLVVGQSPNLLLLVFLAATAARFGGDRSGIGRAGTAATAVRAAQAGSLFLWALDELLRGVNPFRRIGGAAVIAAVPFRRLVR